MKIALSAKTILGGGKYLKNNNLEKSTHYDEFIFSEVENIPEIPQNDEHLASLGLEASVRGDDIPSGVLYTILFYKKTGNTYTFYKRKDFIVGQDSEIELSGDQNYTLIIVSFGTSSKPNISNINDINRVYLDTSSDVIKEVLYQRKDNFIPNGNKRVNYLNIKLKRSSRIRIVIDAGQLIREDQGRVITSISDAKIVYKRPNGINLNDFTSSSSREETLCVTDFTGGYMIKTSDFVRPLIARNDIDVKFSASVKVEDLPYASEIKDLELYGINWGYSQTFHIKQIICGAYLGPNKTNFKEFMCHNLGDGYSGVWTDKFVGNRYAWGRKTAVGKQDNNPYERGNVWTEAENPCPDGYKIPSKAEWESVLNQNHNTRGEIRDKSGKFLGYRIGGRLSLFTHNDFRSWIWTSTPIVPPVGNGSYTRDVWSIFIYHDEIWRDWPNKKEFAPYMDIKHYGQAVRCMKK